MDSLGTKQYRPFLQINYNREKIRMGLSLDEDFLIWGKEIQSSKVGK